MTVYCVAAERLIGVRVAVLKSGEKLTVKDTGEAVFVVARVMFPTLGSNVSGFMALLN